jgi:CheY-like chemotaxis protein/predicted negative regulator of RcsB-dependent stress response
MAAAPPRQTPVPREDRSRVRALVVDENGAARSAIKDLLHASGVGQVQQASDPIRAIRLMEAETYGLVLCEMRFHSQMDGCQVLEYVRTRRLLPPSGAFVLVSAEADRAAVAAAREWQPDAFVLKPLTAQALLPRVEQALRRRAALGPVHEAAERGDAAAVLARARRLERASASGASGMSAPSLELLRWQAQAQVDLGRFDEARATCERALAIRDDLPWAELALAQAERAEGRADAACERLRATIRAHPFFGGAYDLLIEILQQQGRTAKALAVARAALEQIATSRRTRTLGELAYAHGELALAEKCYADLIRKTSASLTRTPLDVGMLGQVFVGQGAGDKALQLVQDAGGELAADVASQALAESVQAQAHAAAGDLGRAGEAARRALALAADGAAPESVALLVARGAFSAGLRTEGEALVGRTLSARGRGAAPGALARKVLGDAGIEPEAFVARATAQAAAAQDAPGGSTQTDAGDAADPVESAVRAAMEAAVLQALGQAVGADAAGDAGVVEGAQAVDGAQTAGGDGTGTATDSAGAAAPSDVELALEALHSARFDEAVAHVERARARLPSNPTVLLAAVQVHLLRMRARGFDARAALEVRRCLAEIDRQIPGERRVFESTGVLADGG